MCRAGKRCHPSSKTWGNPISINKLKWEKVGNGNKILLINPTIWDIYSPITTVKYPHEESELELHLPLYHPHRMVSEYDIPVSWIWCNEPVWEISIAKWASSTSGHIGYRHLISFSMDFSSHMDGFHSFSMGFSMDFQWISHLFPRRSPQKWCGLGLTQHRYLGQRCMRGLARCPVKYTDWMGLSIGGIPSDKLLHSYRISLFS